VSGEQWGPAGAFTCTGGVRLIMSRGTETTFSIGLRSALARERHAAPTTTVPKGATVYGCGDRDRCLYLIERGRIKTLAYSRDGRRCLLSVYVTGDSFGELGLLTIPRTESATAMKTTTLRRIPARGVLGITIRAGLSDEYLRHLVEQSSAQQRTITTMVTMNSEQRLAATLLELGRTLGTPHGEQLRIMERLTHEDLSAMVGTTRSRVGLFLKRFRDWGLISGDSKTIAINERKMERYVEVATERRPANAVGRAYG
jgi:CRP/FNR family cyclic AMP-dependent transcriptional regulator